METPAKPIPKMLYTGKEVAEMTGRKPVTVRRLAIVHEIGFKMGRDWVFTPDDIEKIKAIPKPGRPPSKAKPPTT